MRNVFKTSTDKEGNCVLWYSSRGRLVKVAVYDANLIKSVSEDDLAVLQYRDAEIYLKGFRKGRYG